MKKSIILFIIMMQLAACSRETRQNVELHPSEMRLHATNLSATAQTNPLGQTYNEFRDRWNSLTEQTGSPYSLPALYSKTLLLNDRYLTLQLGIDDAHEVTAASLSYRFQASSPQATTVSKASFLTTWTQLLLTARPQWNESDLVDIYTRFGIDVEGKLFSESLNVQFVIDGLTISLNSDGDGLIVAAISGI